jgi:thiol:disulfide interchange protein
MPNGVNFNELKLTETKVVETFKNAKVKGKNVLVIFDAVWCSVCEEFNQKTMTDPQVVKTLKEDYEVINIDVDTFPEVTKVFGRRAGKSKIEGVPTVMIFSPEGLQQEEFAGSYDGKAFEQILKRNL